ncbi:unnamed protein product [Didymodactylos carnosus]|uniref:Uncharacterized protein n=1 Tax=Didymodactylos carnosus TaxID=1234261 RepID=A0A813PWH5_9BILA|nr:unnamed protein product [Didymodactylos carnosus]CAF0929983.1 unnamed protein product [Didymodactylos carnosus]CAF3539520.1 unnamed protein product [Didymodactylos carnosus]CAF3706663.1 unnamed protein product [Didymodactylos carnosus]
MFYFEKILILFLLLVVTFVNGWFNNPLWFENNQNRFEQRFNRPSYWSDTDEIRYDKNRLFPNLFNRNQTIYDMITSIMVRMQKQWNDIFKQFDFNTNIVNKNPSTFDNIEPKCTVNVDKRNPDYKISTCVKEVEKGNQKMYYKEVNVTDAEGNVKQHSVSYSQFFGERIRTNSSKPIAPVASDTNSTFKNHRLSHRRKY